MSGPATHRVQTTEMNLMVCERCADDAAQIGLKVRTVKLTEIRGGAEVTEH